MRYANAVWATAMCAHMVCAQDRTDDTNTIRSLTPQQAARLVEEFPGVSVQITRNQISSHVITDALPLGGLKTLDAETAKALTGYRKGSLLLSGLTTIDVDAAKALSGFSGADYTSCLYLDGVIELHAQAARALVGLGPKGRSLSLCGLKTLSPGVAESLTHFKGSELALGLTTLDEETAETLARCEGDGGYVLSFPNLSSLSASAAKALALSKAMRLRLGGLRVLQPAAAAHLAQFKGRMGGSLFLGLTSLNADTAKALAEYDGRWLSLPRVAVIDAEVAEAISMFKGEWLYLNGVTELSEGSAKALAQFRGEILCLDGVATLSDEVAAAIAKYESEDLTLDGVKELSDVAARSLSQHRRRLSLAGLKTLTDESAMALARHRGGLSLRGLTSLTNAAATSLSQYEGDLLLEGLTSLSDEAVSVLSTNPGITLPNQFRR